MNKIQNAPFQSSFRRSFTAVHTCGTRSTPDFLYIQHQQEAPETHLVSVCTVATHSRAVLLYIQFSKVPCKGKVGSVCIGKTPYDPDTLYIQQKKVDLVQRKW